MTSRRQFLSRTSAGLLGAAALGSSAAALDAGPIAPAATGAPPTPTGSPSTPTGAAPPLPPGSPPALGTSSAIGPAITPATIAEAEKLLMVEQTPAERELMAGNWRDTIATVHERRSGPRKVALDDASVPAMRWDPRLPDVFAGPTRDRFVRSKAAQGAAGRLPARDDEIAFATVAQLSRWIESRALSSERLTRIYLERLARFQPQLNCVITLTPELALAQAKQADIEISKGHCRGPLHGIPWGAKDLLDTKGIATTYGAEPFRGRVPSTDAVVTQRLARAGAVLVAKLSLGALALNDVWFGGRTNNPWCLEEGSSGSSAGPGAAVAAGLVGFAIGSETDGSIVSPSTRCGVTGLRPTFGRVARTGAMALCWSLDKLGPMARSVEDTLLVLEAIRGPDAGDPSSLPAHLDFDANAGAVGLRVGYCQKWLDESPTKEVELAALRALERLGAKSVPFTLPDWPYGDLVLILFAEAAAAFEELTLSHGLDALKMQVADAWPNTFRQSRFLSAVDFVQADRLRRRVALEMARVLRDVDLLLVPSLRDEMCTLSNFTGHPSLTLRAGFIEIERPRSDWAADAAHPLPALSKRTRVPHSVTLIGRLFDEGTLGRAGVALERALACASERPPGF